MSFVIHCRLLTLLRATHFDVIDLAAVTAVNKEPRHSVAAANFTPTGIMCLMRARLEVERRLCGSTEMTIAGVTGTAPVVANQREMVALALDPRTHHKIVNEWDAPKKARALELTRQLYVNFWVAAEKPTADLSPAQAHAAPAADPDDLFAPAVVAAVGAPITIEQWEDGRKVALRAEFNRLFAAYSAWVRTVVWRVYGGKHGCPDIPAADADVDVFHHLVHVNIMPLIATIPAELRRIALLLTHSIASVASLPASSFAERINSVGGIVSTTGNVSLHHEEISALVPLKVNSQFCLYAKAQLALADDVVDVE
jgi:hypothetical protein